MLKCYVLVCLVVSLLEIILFSYDKVAATDGRFRIPVYVLMLPIGFGGALGAFASLFIYRNKTRKDFFKIPIYFSLILQVGLLLFLILIH